MVTGTQIRAARYLVGISAEQLAEWSGVAAATVRVAEAGEGPPETLSADLDAIRRALETQGVEFLDDGAGVRLSCGR